MDKTNISIAAIGLAGVASIFMIGNRAKVRQEFSSETWEPGNPLPPSVKSLVKQHIEGGNRKVDALMGKVFGMMKVEGPHKGAVLGALRDESKNYTAKSVIVKRENPKFGGTPFKPLPQLPKGKSEYRLRMAPNPNAPLTLAHGLGVLINELYVEKYKESNWPAKSILRIDDTDPDKKNKKTGIPTPPLAEFYENENSMIQGNYKWVCGRNPDIEYVASDHYKDHYEGIKRLLIKEYKGRGPNGWAYLIEGPPGTTINDNIERCRHKTTDENLSQFEWLVKNQKAFYVNASGEMIEDDTCPLPEIRLHLSLTRIKELTGIFGGDIGRALKLQDKNLMRLCKSPHPRHPDIRLWPTLAYQGPFDDWALGISHVIRGADLVDQEDSYHFFYPYVFSDWSDWHPNSELPIFLYWPRFNFIDMGKYLSYTDEHGKIKEINTMSSSALADIVVKPPFNGDWTHENLPTINGLMLKGYKPEEIKRWWFSKFEKTYATSYSKATLIDNPLQKFDIDKKGNIKPNYGKNWFYGVGNIKIKGLNVKYIPLVEKLRKPDINKMNNSEIKGYLNNLIINSSKDIHQWDEESFESFMENISKGISKLRRGDQSSLK